MDFPFLLFAGYIGRSSPFLIPYTTQKIIIENVKTIKWEKLYDILKMF
jgi:hypothetical protein